MSAAATSRNADPVSGLSTTLPGVSLWMAPVASRSFLAARSWYGTRSWAAAGEAAPARAATSTRAQTQERIIGRVPVRGTPGRSLRGFLQFFVLLPERPFSAEQLLEALLRRLAAHVGLGALKLYDE